VRHGPVSRWRATVAGSTQPTRPDPPKRARAPG
jgi:hypothetical protein